MTRSKPYGDTPSILKNKPASSRDTNHDSDSDVSIDTGHISSDNEFTAKPNKADIKPTTFSRRGAGKEKNVQGSNISSRNEGPRSLADMHMQADHVQNF